MLPQDVACMGRGQNWKDTTYSSNISQVNTPLIKFLIN